MGLIDADQVLYTRAYLYWMLQWAEKQDGEYFPFYLKHFYPLPLTDVYSL